jgi:sirohydrochlorin cobaltochelatase
MSSNNPYGGIILFAHGSRDPLWRKPMEAVAARIAEMAPDRPVRCAFLELNSPDLQTSASELIDLGLQAITVVPLFLGVGKHAREDLPLLMTGLEQRYPNVVFNLQPSVGENPRMIDMLAQIALSRD